MKKFDIKAVLILVLALVMVFSLVACDKDGGDPPPPPLPPESNEVTTNIRDKAEFFSTLWNATKSIGETELSATDNLAVELDLGLTLAVNNRSTDKPEEAFGLGVHVSIILDRTEGRLTAAKVQLYNEEKGKLDGNWLTAYYFLDESDTVYVDFAGQQIKFRFDTGFNTYNGEGVNPEGFGPGFYAEQFKKFLEKKVVADASVNDFINGILVNNTGEGWTLNNPVGFISGIFGLETIVRDFIAANPAIGNLLPTILGLTVDEIFNEDGSISLDEILQSNTLMTFFKGVKKTTYKNNPSKIDYTASIDWKNLGSLVSGVTNGFIGEATETTLRFSTNEGDIDGFELYFGLKNLVSGNATLQRYPAITLKIKDINVDKVENLRTYDRAAKLGISKTQYTSDFNLGAEINLDAKGIVLNPSVFDSSFTQAIDMQGVYKLSLNANIDLYNKGADNKTKISAALTKDGTAAPILQLAYQYTGVADKGKLSLSVNDSVKNNDGVSYVQAIIELFGQSIVDAVKNVDEGVAAQLKAAMFKTDGSYNTEFKGVYMDNIDIVALFQKAIKWVAPKAAVTTAESAFFPDDTYTENEQEYNTADSRWSIDVNVLAIFKSFCDAGFFIADGGSLSLNVAELYKTANAVLSGKYGTVDLLLARLFAPYNDWIVAFTDLGILDKVTANDGKAYYQTVNMLDQAEMTLMYEYASGRKTYADYTALMTEKELTAKSETEFDAALSKFLPYIIQNLMADSVFVGDTADKTLSTLAGYGVSIGLNFADGIGLDVSIKDAKDRAHLNLGMKISASDKDITLPAINTDGFVHIRISDSVYA